MVTREEARTQLQMIHPIHQMNIANTLRQARHEYLLSTTQVEFPQFFYACNMEVFNDLTEEELKEFASITDPDVFVDCVIYYMTLYIKKRNKARDKTR